MATKCPIYKTCKGPYARSGSFVCGACAQVLKAAQSDCSHPHAVVKRYVGSSDTYSYCPDCFSTWGGEETPEKKALIAAAALADELGLTPDHEHRS